MRKLNEKGKASMDDCLFCKIASGKIPANLVLEDDVLLAFHDIRPQAPSHLLIIPRRHIATINDCQAQDAELLGRMILAAKSLAKTFGLSEPGYRLVFNINSGGGQEIYHIHLHLLGGRQMIWPPG
jgi:histidine triad (HIT) family protein